MCHRKTISCKSLVSASKITWFRTKISSQSKHLKCLLWFYELDVTTLQLVLVLAHFHTIIRSFTRFSVTKKHLFYGHFFDFWDEKNKIWTVPNLKWLTRLIRSKEYGNITVLDEILRVLEINSVFIFSAFCLAHYYLYTTIVVSS